MQPLPVLHANMPRISYLLLIPAKPPGSSAWQKHHSHVDLIAVAPVQSPQWPEPDCPTVSIN